MIPCLFRLIALSAIFGTVGCKHSPVADSTGSGIRAAASDLSGSLPSYMRRLDRDIRVFRWTKMARTKAATVTPERVYKDLQRGVAAAAEQSIARSAADEFTVMPEGKEKFKSYDDLVAMGYASYVAFSPTESLFFGYNSGPHATSFDDADTDEVSLLTSFIIPKGSVYAMAAHPDALRLASELYKASHCQGYSWKDTTSIKRDGVRGLAGMQAIFRSCPDVKRQLLSYPDSAAGPTGTRVADFTVYSEYSHTYDNFAWDYENFLPTTQIDEGLRTQAKQRWAIMTNLPHAPQELQRVKDSIRLWYQPETSGLADVNPNKRALHCAVKFGSRNRVVRLRGDTWWGTTLNQFQLYFLGYSPQNSGGQYEEILAQYSRAVDRQASSISYPASAEDLWSDIDMPVFPASPTIQEYKFGANLPGSCPSLYALSLSKRPNDVAFAESLTQKRDQPLCPFLPQSIAFGVDATLPKFVDIAHDFPQYANDEKIQAECNTYYRGYSEIVRSYQEWPARISECGSPAPEIAPWEINQVDPKFAIDKCDDATTADMQEWFLSKGHIADDLPNEEIGDDWSFILNLLRP